MNNEELLIKMKNIKYNLENTKKQLINAQNILNGSITFNNKGFKNGVIVNLNSKLTAQINNLNNKIIYTISNM